MYVQDMKFLWLNLCLGGLSTEDTNINNNAKWKHTMGNSLDLLLRLFGIYAK